MQPTPEPDKPAGQFPNPATQFQPGVSGNPNGRPKGRRSLSTIIREMLEGEDKFFWDEMPQTAKAFHEKHGDATPWEVIVYKAVNQASEGDQQAREWLRKAGYGDQLDITPVLPEGVSSIIYASKINVQIVKPEDAATNGSTPAA